MHKATGIAVLLTVGMLGSGCSTLLRPLKGSGPGASAFGSRPKQSAFGATAAVNPVFASAPEAKAPAPRPAVEAKPASRTEADFDALFGEPAPRSRRLQEDPQFSRLNQEMLELDQAERDYRKATRLELKSACAKRQAKACELLERRSRNADARHALEKKYRASAG